MFVANNTAVIGYPEKFSFESKTIAIEKTVSDSQYPMMCSTREDRVPKTREDTK